MACLFLTAFHVRENIEYSGDCHPQANAQCCIILLAEVNVHTTSHYVEVEYEDESVMDTERTMEVEFQVEATLKFSMCIITIIHVYVHLYTICCFVCRCTGITLRTCSLI